MTCTATYSCSGYRNETTKTGCFGCQHYVANSETFDMPKEDTKEPTKKKYNYQQEQKNVPKFAKK